MKPDDSDKAVTSDVYDQAYFLEHMEGADVFARSQGGEVSPRLMYALRLVEVRPGQRTLDLGCGRGEVAWQCAQRGAQSHALDYAWAALQIAAGLRANARRAGLQFHVEQADAQRLPFASESFDSVFMLDIVEHLYPPQLEATFAEVHRLLRPGGHLVVHTMPNADYYRWGYPLYRLASRLVGRKLPRDPRQRWCRGETHVNLQTPRGLRRTLRGAGFISPRVWLTTVNANSRWRWLIGFYPWRWVLCNDILAVAVKT